MRRMLLVLVLVLLGVAAPAASQQNGGTQDAPPTELWQEYPLETVPSDPSTGQEQPPAGDDQAGGGQPPAQQERSEPAAGGGSESDDGGMATFALIAIVLLVLVASAGIARLGLSARRSRKARAGRAEPAQERRRTPAPKPAAAPAANGGSAAAAATARPAAAKAAAAPAEPPAEPKPEPPAPQGEPPAPKAEPPAPKPEPQPVAAKPEPPAAKPEPKAAPEPAEPAPPARDAPRRPRPTPVPGNGHHPSNPIAPVPDAARAPAQAKGEPSEAAGGRRARQVAPEDERALGYTTVSRPEDAERQLKLEARQIQLACKKRGLPLKKLVRDLESNGGADLTRPGLSFALERLAKGEYTCLVVTSLDRLTRSAANLGTLIYLLEERRTRLIVVDIDLDTGTEEGRVAARALVKVSGLERRKLEEQTRKGLEAARDKRRSSGRPAVADRPTLRRRIAEMRAGGMTLQAIADTLNEEGVPTLRGGAQWRPSSVQAAAGYKRPARKTGARARKGNGSDD